jgi:hypothetical protein
VPGNRGNPERFGMPEIGLLQRVPLQPVPVHGALPVGRERFSSVVCAHQRGARILEQGRRRAAQRTSTFSASATLRVSGLPGGPMWYADNMSLGTVYRRICSFRERYGERWAPASLLECLAGGGQSFAEHDAG